MLVIGEQGLAVVRVDPNGKAAEIGLAPGNIIVEVGGKEMASSRELAVTSSLATE